MKYYYDLLDHLTDKELRDDPHTDTLYSLAAAITELYNTCTPDSEADWIELKRGFDDLISCLNEGATPEEYFDRIGYGHFKECFYLAPHYVVKFCAIRNPTEDEFTLYKQAQGDGWGDLFLPTEIVDLPMFIPSAVLEPDDTDECYNEDTHMWEPVEEDNTQFCAVQFQYRAAPTYAGEDEPLFRSVYDSGWDKCELKSFNGTPIARDQVQNLDGIPCRWITRFLELYGFNRLYAFDYWLERNRVWDLHSDNVGTTDLQGKAQLPIIMDWMSK